MTTGTVVDLLLTFVMEASHDRASFLWPLESHQDKPTRGSTLLAMKICHSPLSA